MAYGNGLMHVSSGGRRYLHHTGGMVSFSSAFHVDTGNGVGAFASSSISAFAEYRPRDLTFFAVQALTAARVARPGTELSPSRKMAVTSHGRRTAASPHSCDLAPRQ